MMNEISCIILNNNFHQKSDRKSSLINDIFKDNDSDNMSDNSGISIKNICNCKNKKITDEIDKFSINSDKSKDTKKFKRSFDFNSKKISQPLKSSFKVNDNHIKCKKRLKTNDKLHPVENIKNKKKCCKCKNSKCIQLHCKCFKSNKQCDSNCCNKECMNQNKIKFDDSKQLLNKPFNPPQIIIKDNIGININPNGCQCTKGCNKKYCLCFNNSFGCSPICKCKNCLNQKIVIDPESVRKICKLRKSKNKLSIMTTNLTSKEYICDEYSNDIFDINF